MNKSSINISNFHICKVKFNVTLNHNNIIHYENKKIIEHINDIKNQKKKCV